MGKLRIYEINTGYIDYLASFIPHLFHNKKSGQQNERKYIGIVLEVHDQQYFAPLSSFKAKHRYMNEGLDLIKIKRLAVINLNNMFPVPPSQIVNFDIKKVKDQKYKALLQREYRIITSIEDQICENAGKLYEYKIEKGDSTPLAERCNDFLLLEEKALEFISKSVQGRKNRPWKSKIFASTKLSNRKLRFNAKAQNDERASRPKLPEVSQNKEAADTTFDKILWDITHKNFTNKFYFQTIK